MAITLDKLSLYSMLSKDSDLSVTKYQGMEERIKNLYSRVLTIASFIKPELISLPDETLNRFINEQDELNIYRHFFDDMLRMKKHTLTSEEERLLAMAAPIADVSYEAFTMLTNVDIKFPSIKNKEGKEIELSHGRYYSSLFSQDREYRENVYKSYLSTYKQYSNTLSVTFNGALKANVFYAKARDYNSAIEASLDRNNIPVPVYDNLIEAVNNNLKPLHRWAALRKKILKVDEFHPYDCYVSVFNLKEEKEFSYDEAVELVFKSLKPLGEEYLSSLKKAFDSRWIDVYETKNKKSGAYSSGTTYGVHPYVLLNWNNLLNDVFTLAHEIGHNMHSYFTGLSQPYPYANYSIFLAEVASTFNESLLLDYMIEDVSDDNEKLYLIEKYIDNITATFYRQVMFAEFERVVYSKIEQGLALTSDVLCELYKSIYAKYWGPEMVIDEEEAYTWSRVPHFYYNFYVYQYATGFAAAEILSHKVRKEGISSVEKYLKFLKAGSSDYPLNILNEAGANMNTAEPIIATAKKMDELITRIENILKIK